MRQKVLKNIKKIVIKVGTSTLANENGLLNEDLIKSLVAQICELKKRGFEVVLVSSGAVGAGMGLLNVSKRPKNISEKQALAAVGQVALMHLYERIFWAYSTHIAQLLLTRIDFSDHRRFLNARSVANTLLARKIVPIINENDPVVADELKVGDNDTLSALVCGLIDADLLIILSDIDGLYDKNPSTNSDAKLINLVRKVDENITKMAGCEGSKFGTGGMMTKLSAAKISNAHGSHLIIANGKTPEILIKIINQDEIGTLFLANNKGQNAKKFWLSWAANKPGSIVVDDGAKSALKNGKSLLSVGIKCVNGEFERGEIVEILDIKNNIIASGMVNYKSDEITKIMGINSEKMAEILEHKTDDEVIHADNIALK